MSAFLTVLTSNQKILEHFVTWFDILRQLTVSTFNLHSVGLISSVQLGVFSCMHIWIF